VIDKFIYVHILKTAGTTIRYEIFEKHYKGKYLYDDMFKMKRNPDIKKFEHPVIIENQKNHPKYKKYNVIFGHFKYDKYNHLNFPMFSFIRHPVDRVLSQYYYHKGLYEKNGKKLSVMEFCRQWPNHMSDVLGDPKKYKFIGVVDQMKRSFDMMCDYLELPRQHSIMKKRVGGDDMVKRTPKKIRRKIEQLNDIDMQLYHMIMEKIRGEK